MGGVAIGHMATAMRSVAIGEGAEAPEGTVTFCGTDGITSTIFRIYQPFMASNGPNWNSKEEFPYGGLEIITEDCMSFVVNEPLLIPFDKLNEVVNGGGSGGGGGSSSSASFNYGAYFNYEKKYKDCSSIDDMNNISGYNDYGYYNWRNDLDENDAWNYNLESMSSGMPDFQYWYEGYSNYPRSLRAFNSYMPNITDLEGSFRGCSDLESWECYTRNCHYFQNTFTGCIKLKHWRGSFSNNQTPNCYQMFGTYGSDCTQLDLASVQHIAQVIPYGSWNTITLGVSSNLNGNYELEVALNELYSKSWNVEVIYSSNG
jgi:hypothetical protein